MIKFFTAGDAWTDIGFTFRSTIFGFLIGTTCGSLLGLSFWWSRNYAAIVQPYIICFESLPKLALAPLVILVFGIGLASKVAIATALTLVVSTLTTYAGVKAVDPDQEKLFYSLGASRLQVFRKLVVPFCLPWIISVLRVNIGLALTGAIVGEFIASQHGLGRANPLCRQDLRYRAGLGRRAGALDAGRDHVCRGVLAREHAAQRHQAISQIATAGPTDEVVMTPRSISRRKFLGATALAGAAVIARPMIARADTKEVLIAEPVHGTGYLPLYIGMAKNLFEDVTVKIVTIETGGGHTNAVLSGQAFAFIGGPEHCAYAKIKGRRAARRGQLRRPRQRLLLRGKGTGTRQHRLAELFQRQDDRDQRLWRHAEFDHALSPEEMESRRHERRHAGGNRQFGDPAGGQEQAGADRLLDRAVHHPGRAHRRVGRAVHQYPEGDGSLRLFDLQRAARHHPERSRAGPRLRPRHDEVA